jgi:hypothetical protein
MPRRVATSRRSRSDVHRSGFPSLDLAKGGPACAASAQPRRGLTPSAERAFLAGNRSHTDFLMSTGLARGRALELGVREKPLGASSVGQIGGKNAAGDDDLEPARSSVAVAGSTVPWARLGLHGIEGSARWPGLPGLATSGLAWDAADRRHRSMSAGSPVPGSVPRARAWSPSLAPAARITRLSCPGPAVEGKTAPGGRCVLDHGRGLLGHHGRGRLDIALS